MTYSDLNQRPTLRPYQLEAIERLDQRVAAGVRRAVLVSAVGSGKTTIASAVILRAIERGQRVLFLAHRRELINQAYQRLLHFGLPASCVGVMMGNDSRRRPNAPVQVASVDTLRNRSKPVADVVFTDECHRATAKSYRNIAACYPDALHLGLTATPYRANGKGLSDAYDELIVVTTPKQLIAEGYLVQPRVFTVPKAKRPDLRGVRVARGDYSPELLEQAMNKQALVGNIVEHWKQHAEGIRTVVFAVSIAHSKHVIERFQEAGVPAEHLDGTMPTEQRDGILRRLADGETQVVSNVMCICEGWDLPSVKCAILARPTKSTGLYLQQVGRIMRPWEDHEAILLDHGGCVLEHGLPHDDRDFDIEGKKKRAGKPGEAPVRVCPDCNAVVHLSVRVCPECGCQLASDRDVPEESKGTLVEVTEDTLRKPKKKRYSRSIYDELRDAARKHRSLDWSTLEHWA